MILSKLFNNLFYKVFFIFFLMSKIYCFDTKKYNTVLKDMLFHPRDLDQVRHIKFYFNYTLKDYNDKDIKINAMIKNAIRKYLKMDTVKVSKVEEKKYKEIEYLNNDYVIYIEKDSILNDVRMDIVDGKKILYSDIKGLDFILTDKIEFYLEDKEYLNLSDELKKNYEIFYNVMNEHYKKNYNKEAIIDELKNIANYNKYVKNIEYFVDEKKEILLKVTFKNFIENKKIVFFDKNKKPITNYYINDFIDKKVLKEFKDGLSKITNLEDIFNYKDPIINDKYDITIKIEDNTIIYNVTEKNETNTIKEYLEYEINDNKKSDVAFVKDLYENEINENQKKGIEFYKLLIESCEKNIKDIDNEDRNKSLYDCYCMINSLRKCYSEFQNIYKNIIDCKKEDNLIGFCTNKIKEKMENLKIEENYKDEFFIDYFSDNLADLIKYNLFFKEDYVSKDTGGVNFTIIDTLYYKFNTLYVPVKKIDEYKDIRNKIITKNEEFVKNLLDEKLKVLKNDCLEKYKNETLNNLLKNEHKLNKYFYEGICQIASDVRKDIIAKLFEGAKYKEILENLSDKEKKIYIDDIYKRYFKILTDKFKREIFSETVIKESYRNKLKEEVLLSIFENQKLKEIDNLTLEEIVNFLLDNELKFNYGNYISDFKNEYCKFVKKFIKNSEENILKEVVDSTDFVEFKDKLKERFNILIKEIIEQFTDNEIKEIDKFTKLNEVNNYKNKEKEKFKKDLVNHISIKSDHFKQNYDKFNKDSTNLLFNNDAEYVDPYFSKISSKLNEKRNQIENDIKITNTEANKLFTEMKDVVNNVEKDIKEKLGKITKSDLKSYKFTSEEEINKYIESEFKKIEDFDSRYNSYSNVTSTEGQKISDIIASKKQDLSKLLKQNYDIIAKEKSIVKINYSLQNEDQFNENIKTKYNQFINNEENKKFDSRKQYKDLYKFIESKFNVIEDIFKDNKSIKYSEDVINDDEITLILKVKEKPDDDKEKDKYKPKDKHKEEEEHKNNEETIPMSKDKLENLETINKPNCINNCCCGNCYKSKKISNRG